MGFFVLDLHLITVLLLEPGDHIGGRQMINIKKPIKYGELLFRLKKEVTTAGFFNILFYNNCQGTRNKGCNQRHQEKKYSKMDFKVEKPTNELCLI